jgi:hypothetical protein
MEMRIAIQAESKLSQIRQSPAKAEQRKSKKKALISFDFLVRIEPFQRVMLTPWAKNSFASSSLRCPWRGPFRTSQFRPITLASLQSPASRPLREIKAD